MRLIPESAYKAVERRLREWQPVGKASAVERAERQLQEAALDAANLSGPMSRDGAPGGKGTPSDPTGRAADRIAAARERLERARAWDEVFRRTVRDFKPGTPEHKTVSLHYMAGWTMAAIARSQGVDRQTVVRRKDNFLYRAAYYAAEAGLTRRDTHDA